MVFDQTLNLSGHSIDLKRIIIHIHSSVVRCLNFSCDSSIKHKRAAILFYKKVVPLKFGFCSLGNEQNFLSNQKAGKLMNVTRNK